VRILHAIEILIGSFEGVPDLQIIVSFFGCWFSWGTIHPDLDIFEN